MWVAALGLTITVHGSTALAQGLPAFEVASVRPSPEMPPAQGAAGVHITKQQVRFAYLSLRDYLSIAFNVPIHQISGPEWINSARFDIAATMPATAKDEDFPQMIEALLRDRFRLQAHRESRDAPVYALEVGRDGTKLVASPDDTPKDAPFTVTSSGGPDGISADLGSGSSFTLTNTRFEFKKVTMQTLADTLGRFMRHPVLDRTNLQGRYDVGFAIAPQDYMPLMIRSAVNAGITLPPQALQLLDAPSLGSVEDGLRSLGLSLEERRAPLAHLVVDSIERTPTEN
jgi:uncharacterized protein (TIGR03435 family)